MRIPEVAERCRAGDQVLFRDVRNAPVNMIVPVTVVRDDGDLIALFAAVGRTIKVRAAVYGTPFTHEVPLVEREGKASTLVDWTWTSNHVLMLAKPGEWSAIWLMWNDSDWAFRGYYGNIRTPMARTSTGFDAVDLLLDVSIDPDLSWRWKDEDEYQIAWKQSLVSRRLMSEARAKGEQIVADVEGRRWPFGAGLEVWRPDPSWPVPCLPDNWNEGLVLPN